MSDDYTRRSDLSVVVPLQDISDVVSNPRVQEAAGSTDYLAKVFRAWSTATFATTPNLRWQAGTRTLSILGGSLEIRYTVQDLNDPVVVSRKTTLAAGNYVFGANSILLVPLGLEQDIAISPPNIVTPSGAGSAAYVATDAQAQALLASTLADENAASAIALVQFARISGSSLSLFNRLVLRDGVLVTQGYTDTAYAGLEETAALWRAVNQDRNLLITGGGDVEFSSPMVNGVVTFSSALKLFLPRGVIIDVPAPLPLTLTPAQNVLAVVLTRTDATTTTGSLFLTSLANVPSGTDNRILILAIWRVDEDRLYWVNGNVHRDGDIFPIGLSGRIPAVEAAELQATVLRFPSAVAANAGMLAGSRRVGWVVNETSFPGGPAWPAMLSVFTPVTRESLTARIDAGLGVGTPWEVYRAFAFMGEHLAYYGDIGDSRISVSRFTEVGGIERGEIAAGTVVVDTLTPTGDTTALIEVRSAGDVNDVILDVKFVRVASLYTGSGDVIEVRSDTGDDLSTLRAQALQTRILQLNAGTYDHLLVWTYTDGVLGGLRAAYYSAPQVRSDSTDADGYVEVRTQDGLALTDIRARYARVAQLRATDAVNNLISVVAESGATAGSLRAKSYYLDAAGVISVPTGTTSLAFIASDTGTLIETGARPTLQAGGFLTTEDGAATVAAVVIPVGATTAAHLPVRTQASAPAHVVARNTPVLSVAFTATSDVLLITPVTLGGVDFDHRIAVVGRNLAYPFGYVRTAVPDRIRFFLHADTDLDVTGNDLVGVGTLAFDPTEAGFVFGAVAHATKGAGGGEKWIDVLFYSLATGTLIDIVARLNEEVRGGISFYPG